MSETNIENLEPNKLWTFFNKICSIPHPSHREEALARWLLETANNLGLEASIDATLNVIVKKPASPGYENRKGVILQAHIDMVPQALPEAHHDFTKDSIRPVVSGEWVTAQKTTLGADNGIGVAAALSVLVDKTLKHGPLECIFTTNEEDGMSGARGLSPIGIKGTYLINLDGEDSNEITLGCAGTARITSVYNSRGTTEGLTSLGWYSITLTGLLGGHSGVDIHRGRGNAGILLCKLLAETGVPYVAALESGTAANAIPRDAQAVIGIPKADAEWINRFNNAVKSLQSTFAQTDPGLVVNTTEAPAPDYALPPAAVNPILNAILALPNGLLSVEPSNPAWTRTSSNLGIVKIKHEDKGMFFVETYNLVRSSDEKEKNDIVESIESILFKLGATTRKASSAPAWEPDQTTSLAKTAIGVFTKLFSKEPVLSCTHGALECGLFRTLYPSWEMISIGPTIQYPHSPDERVHIGSVQQFWTYLTALLAELP